MISRRILLVAVGSMFLFCEVESDSSAAEQKIKLLIIDGQNNHNWKQTTPVLRSFLKASGKFSVDVATTPPRLRGKTSAEQKVEIANNWKSFRPEFKKYDVILSNYNGQMWPDQASSNFGIAWTAARGTVAAPSMTRLN